MSQHSGMMFPQPRTNDKSTEISATNTAAHGSSAPNVSEVSKSRKHNDNTVPDKELKLNTTSPSPQYSGVSGGIGYQRRPKPPFSYIALIAMAIRSSPSGMATLSEINDYLRTKFAFFRGEYSGWRNSVRHNLSLNDCFRKILRDPSRPWGKDNYWTLRETADFTFSDGVFQRRRRRATTRVKKEENLPNLTISNLEKSVKCIGSPTTKHGICVQTSLKYNPFTIDNLLKPTSPWQSAKDNSVSKAHNSKVGLPTENNKSTSHTTIQWNSCSNKPKRHISFENVLDPLNPELQRNQYDHLLGIPTLSTRGIRPGAFISDHHPHLHPLSFACPYAAHCPLDTELPTVGYIYSPFQFMTDLQHLPCHIATTYHTGD